MRPPPLGSLRQLALSLRPWRRARDAPKAPDHRRRRRSLGREYMARFARCTSQSTSAAPPNSPRSSRVRATPSSSRRSICRFPLPAVHRHPLPPIAHILIASFCQLVFHSVFLSFFSFSFYLYFFFFFFFFFFF